MAQSDCLKQGNLPGYLSHGLGMLKDLNKDIKNVLEIQPYVESMNKCIAIMTNINSRMSEEERKVLGKLEEFRHQSNLAIDASHKVTSKIKISVSSFISALQGKESAVTNACLACEKYVGEIKELRKIVAEVK